MKKVDTKLSIITKACEDKKGIDIKALNIANLTTVADYFVIVSGNSSNQVMSISDEIEEKMMEAGFDKIGKEGYRSGRWILLDFGDVLAHVFHKDEREFYNLERLWSDIEERKNINN